MKRLSGRRIAAVSIALLAFWAVAVMLALAVGSVAIPPGSLLRLLGHKLIGFAPADDPLATILFSIRLPRILLGSLVGAALAAAGASFQSLLRNPLADPFVRGVSTGASLGTILYSIFTASWAAAGAAASLAYGRPMAAFAGAALVIGAVYFLSAGGSRTGEASQRLLLAGIVLASFISSINIVLLTSTSQADLRGIFYWLIGDLSRPVDASIYVVTGVVFAGFVLLYPLSRSLNLISIGEEDAMILGVAVARVKVAVYLLASLVTGAVVSVSGPIAYIGLICPHLGRMMFGSDNRILLPAVFMFGAIFTLLADTLARTLFSPAELPVGVITALLGAPLFVYLSRRRSSL
jgi:iron complex transport system permease protein